MHGAPQLDDSSLSISGNVDPSLHAHGRRSTGPLELQSPVTLTSRYYQKNLGLIRQRLLKVSYTILSLSLTRWQSNQMEKEQSELDQRRRMEMAR